jgi:hypothetical protein
MLFPGRCYILAFSAVLTRSEGITRLAATLRPLLHRRPTGILIVTDPRRRQRSVQGILWVHEMS